MSIESIVQRKLFSILRPSGRQPRIKASAEYKLIKNSTLFDEKFYISAYPDVAGKHFDPILHYVLHGWREGRNPSAAFNTKRYIRRHNLPEGVNPLSHYIQRQGAKRSSLDASPENIAEWQIETDSIAMLPDPQPTEIGVFVHLFYEELAAEILSKVKNIPFPYRIYISTDSEEKRESIESVLAELALVENSSVKVLPNFGWDLGPFLVGFNKEIQDHEICLRLHAKKSTFQEAEWGARWRRHLLSDLVGHPMLANATIALFMNNKDLGFVIPSHWEGIRDSLGIGSNFKAMEDVLQRIDIRIKPEQPIEYPSGSMFWFRSKALSPLLKLGLDWKDFSLTDGDSRDGTLAHGIERSLLFFGAKAGFRWAKTPGQQMLSELTDEECVRLLRDSGEFDRAYYVKRDRNVLRGGWDPLEHYVKHGWLEARKPFADFNVKYYEACIESAGYKDVNPLIHYVIVGKEEGLETERKGETPAAILVDDIYGAYRKVEDAPAYVKETSPIIRDTTVKPVAFYLPQFHPFEENNRFWGRGFTEWTNTTKALPMFPGHYQPRLPGELGFYDTRMKEVLSRQMELARQYGIYGFCFHHYFFNGKPVMRAPYNHILADKSLDLPFCLHWANEPWTVRWDGLAQMTGTLLDQHHSPADDIAFFKDIEPAITDPRYITVGGRPLLVIYRPGLFPDMQATIDRWRGCCREIGLPDLYLVVMQTSFEGVVDPQEYGFDAAVEFPPHNFHLTRVSKSVTPFDPGFEGEIYDYREAAETAMARSDVSYTLFRGIMSDWDCTPRRANPGVFINSSPSLYRSWLEGLCRKAQERLPEDRRFIFINAWNEWGEGAYLEPDRRHGYGYLDATAKALNACEPARTDRARLRMLAGAHIFYTDLLPEFVAKFGNIERPYDLVITTPHDKVDGVRRYLARELGGVRSEVVGVGPIGRDFAPFIFEFLPRAASYEVCCWVHSKKSLYEPAYAGWRSYLLRNLLGSPENVSAIMEAFAKDEKLGLVYPAPFDAIADKVEWGSNYELCRYLLGRLGIEIGGGAPRFPTAAMFWFRPKALEALTRLGLTMDDFARNADGARDPRTNLVTDGTISHALERMIIYVTEASGHSVREFLFER